MLSKGLAFEKRDPFSIVSAEKKDWLVTLHIKSIQKKSRCPCCRTYSKSVHSHYQRTLKDLPAFGNQVLLQVKVRRFYCRNKKCKRKIFTERFNEHFSPYSRISKRLEEKLLKLALLMGGNPGEKLCRTLHIERSSSSLIRLIHRQKLPPPEKVLYLGIDDWAKKKRHTYGTCLVDLERHKMVELLKDREAHSVENWLKKHPEVSVVSRDRFLNYNKGIRSGAPQAIQVGDRWHLLKNLGDSLQKLLERNRQHLKYIRRVNQSSGNNASNSNKEKRTTQNYSHRVWQMAQIKVLRSEGLGLKAIARRLQMARVTVRKYLLLHEPPPRGGCAIRVNIALFDQYLRQRTREVPGIEMLQLFKEIKARGYNGGRTVAFEHLHKYVDGRLDPKRSKSTCIFFLPSKIRMLLFKKTEDLSSKEHKLFKRLCTQCPQIEVAYSFARQFKIMMENKEGHCLKKWITEVIKSGVPELVSFARGLLSDFEATKNALTLPWSNGQVEGQINKLKTIKRQMYGRASFALLRKRLLLNTS